MATKTVLSFAQEEVITKLRDGWELGHSTGFSSHTWMQQGGCGKGGPSVKVNFGTLISLVRRGLIKYSDKQTPFADPKIYVLTELGRTIDFKEARP